MKSPQRALVVALAVATLLKLYLALATQGSLDARGFLDHLEKIRELGVGAYRVRGAFDNPFNSPPPMIHVIRFWGWLADSTGLQFRFWLRLPSILADIGSFVLVARWVAKTWPDAERFKILLALALSPAAILLSGYHGNTDSLMIFFVLLSIYFAEGDQQTFLAGIVFGLALCVKIMPLAFTPAIFLYLSGLRRRVEFFGSAILTFALCAMPYLAQDPQAIRSAVFGYASIYGRWGWSQLAVLLFPEMPTYLHKPFDVQGSHATFAQILKLTTVALSCAATIWLNRGKAKPNLFLQFGFITALVLFMAPGFGSQYLVWLVPFVAALGARLALLYYVASGLYLTAVFMCNEYSTCTPSVIIVALSLFCWLSIFVLILAFHRFCKQQKQSKEAC